MKRIDYILLLLIPLVQATYGSSIEPKMSNRIVLETSMDKSALLNLSDSFQYKFIDTFETNSRRYFILETGSNKTKRSSFDESDFINESIKRMLDHPNVTSVIRESLLERSKRDFLPIPLNFVPHQSPGSQRGFRKSHKSSTSMSSAIVIPRATGVSTSFTRFSRNRNPQPRLLGKANSSEQFGLYSKIDPMWRSLWYINRHSFNPSMTDMNIISAWKQGFSGKGISVTFLDDGLERDHPDIIENYDRLASWDFNDNDNDPMPRYDITNENKHGTRCAGEVAATANNSICSIGIAYNAGIGGIRMLDGPITDSVEAKSLSLNNQHIDIYSASWGPTDNGEQLDGPDRLTLQALSDGVNLGRKGLGSIFTWASGNGGIYGDSCACDGYVNSIYTFAISSTTDQGTKPWYLEECSSVLTTTYSSGDIKSGQHSIATTDLRHKCTEKHTATSASAPIAAGIIALTLEANPQLTWRDVMYIIVLTSRPKAIPSNNYFANKAGFLVSSRYGFGLMDAGRMVEIAQRWTTVPRMNSCTANKAVISEDEESMDTRALIRTDGCAGTAHQVSLIEQVEVIVSLRTPTRGEIELHLTSPMGTRQLILPKRPRDRSNHGLNRWRFNTVQLWGESPIGEWTLEVTNFFGRKFILDDFELLIHGTSVIPLAYSLLANNNDNGTSSANHSPVNKYQFYLKKREQNQTNATALLE